MSPKVGKTEGQKDIRGLRFSMYTHFQAKSIIQ